jgi:Biotin-requiring enzyme
MMLLRVARSSTTLVHRPVVSRALLSTYRPTPSLWSAQLPYHLVVGLPALSPTMEVGTLAEWYVNEGDVFHAGDALAKIETDKAAMDFEAQDDGVVARLLVPAGNGADSCVYSVMRCRKMCCIFCILSHTISPSLCVAQFPLVLRL